MSANLIVAKYPSKPVEHRDRLLHESVIPPFTINCKRLAAGIDSPQHAFDRTRAGNGSRSMLIETCDLLNQRRRLIVLRASVLRWT